MSKDNSEDLDKITNPQIKRLLQLAQEIKDVDYSGQSKVRHSLKKELLNKIKERKEEQELSDNELDLVAGGINNPKDDSGDDY
ncbi:MAG: hypothetical protein ACQERJ_03665 [Bacillota bacterium]